MSDAAKHLRDLQKAKLNKGAYETVHGGMAVVSIIVGIYLQSWYIGIALFLFFTISFRVKFLNIISAVIFAAFCATMMAAFTKVLIADNTDLSQLNWYQTIIYYYSNTPAQITSGFTFLTVLGMFFAGTEWMNDTTDK